MVEVEAEESVYTYTLYDGDPDSSGGCELGEVDQELVADSLEEAVEEVEELLSLEAAGLSREQGYEAGDRLYALVWDHQGCVTAKVIHVLTDEDLG